MQRPIPSDATTNMPSPNLWKNCPELDLLMGYKQGTYMYDDFHNWNGATTPGATPVLVEGKYPYRAATTATNPSLIKVATGHRGEIIGTVTLDNECCTLQTGDVTTACPTNLVTITANSGKPVWFEGRVKVGTVTAAQLDFYFGLVKGGLTGITTTFFSDTTGTMSTISSLGFTTLSATPTALNTSYGTDSGAIVAHEAATSTWTVSTYKKIGGYFDGKTTFKWSVDNDWVDEVEVSAANFPDTIAMGLAWSIKGAATATITSTLDWWKLAMVDEP